MSNKKEQFDFPTLLEKIEKGEEIIIDNPVDNFRLKEYMNILSGVWLEEHKDKVNIIKREKRSNLSIHLTK